jgi:hypothetical protein
MRRYCPFGYMAPKAWTATKPFFKALWSLRKPFGCLRRNHKELYSDRVAIIIFERAYECTRMNKCAFATNGRRKRSRSFDATVARVSSIIQSDTANERPQKWGNVRLPLRSKEEGEINRTAKATSLWCMSALVFEGVASRPSRSVIGETVTPITRVEPSPIRACRPGRS